MSRVARIGSIRPPQGEDGIHSSDVPELSAVFDYSTRRCAPQRPDTQHLVLTQQTDTTYAMRQLLQ